MSDWKCKAQPTADPPQDCDWPFCNCDRHAEKVFEAIQESGKTIIDDNALARLNDFFLHGGVTLSEENDALIEENKRLKADSSFAWLVVSSLVVAVIGWVAVMSS